MSTGLETRFSSRKEIQVQNWRVQNWFENSDLEIHLEKKKKKSIPAWTDLG